MGDFRMTIEGMGGHGCDRNAKQGDEVRGCGSETCPDCIFARFVSELQRAGLRPTKAIFHHWPADMVEHDFPAVPPSPKTSNEKPEIRCTRCNVPRAEAEAAKGSKEFPAYCRIYDAAREVVDDYTERSVKYPTGGFRRATGLRIKGSF